MVKRNGPGGSHGSGNDGSNLRNRIEGFGNSAMPPPVPESFEDRLHSALASNESFGEWYTSARASVDTMVTAFDDTVNAIADTIEDTVAAVVGDDDVWDPEPAKNKTKEKADRKNRPDKDDGERSGIKWGEIVEKICDEGDLDNFVLTVTNQCANTSEEKEVGGLLSDKLLQADKPSNTLRVLYVMQSVEEGDLPDCIDVIRTKCEAKLTQLKTSTLHKALATQVLGDGPAPKTEEQKKEEEKAQKKKDKKEKKAAEATEENRFHSRKSNKPVDLLDVQASAKTEKTSQSKDPMDLLDSSPAVAAAAAAAAPTIAAPAAPAFDLLDMATPASAQPAQDLLSLEVTPMLQVTAPPAPMASLSQASSGFSSSMNVPPSSTSQPQNDMFASFQMGGPSAGPSAGYQQAFGASPMMTSSSNFDPNAKPSVPAMKFIDSTQSQAAMDPFASLASFPSSSPMQSQGQKVVTGLGQKVVTGASSGFGAGRTQAQPAPQKDALGLDDILSSEFAKMGSAH